MKDFERKGRLAGSPWESENPDLRSLFKRDGYFLKGHPEPEKARAALDEIGAKLSEVFALEADAIRKLRVLWNMYRADCERLRVEPKTRVRIR